MGGKGSGKQKSKPKAPTSTMQAQGKTAIKRTPNSAFDPAKDQDVYDVELVVAERLCHGESQYMVK